MKKEGVTHVMVHLERFGPEAGEVLQVYFSLIGSIPSRCAS